MKISLLRFIASLMLFLPLASVAFAQEAEVSVVIYFKKESARFEPDFRNNGARLEEFIQKVNAYKDSSRLVSIHLESYGTSSPEGEILFNEIISRARTSCVSHQILKHTNITEQLLTEKHSAQDWELLAELVEADPKVTTKGKILGIIRNGGADRLERMKEIEYARPFWYIYHNVFPDMRACRITAHYKINEPVTPIEHVCQSHVDIHNLSGIIWDTPAEIITTDAAAVSDIPVTESGTVKPRQWIRKITVKTNAIGWGLLAMNIAAEIDITENWSVSIPFYYSGTNYFTETVKFRGAVLQPEIRYNIPQKRGLYAGAHLGAGLFNCALGGKYRIQDAGGKRPAWGGGLSAGYKMQFKKNQRWGMEFSLGAGIYDAKYDKFYNEPNGPYVEQGIHKTFIGVDNAAVSLTYSFDFRKKEEWR